MQVVLEDVSSGEQLVFDFQQWVGQVGGDIRKEMPLVSRETTPRRGGCDQMKYDSIGSAF